jgi:phosphotransferase system enzyme I (PtsP)
MENEQGYTLGLRTLEDISGLILHSHDLHETLDNIVNLVAKRMGVDVCSIYLLEDDGETLRLKASKGLSRSSVGKVAMKTSEGLTGLVIEEKGVVSIENAPAHPRFKYFRETHEEKFHSFLGFPLFERKTPVGVIVIQTKEPRIFNAAEISTLATIAYQISSIVINAKLLDSIRMKEEERARFERELERMRSYGQAREERGFARNKKRRRSQMLVGTPVLSGFCWGKIYLLNRRDSLDGIDLRVPSDRGRTQAFSHGPGKGADPDALYGKAGGPDPVQGGRRHLPYPPDDPGRPRLHQPDNGADR